jgi:polysaccharide biosynthesis/export protein
MSKTNLRYIKGLALLLVSFSLLPSCIDTKKTVYFNNIQDTIILNKTFTSESPIQKADLLNISISSLNPEASSIFNNIPISSALVSSNSSLTANGGTLTSPPQQLGYLVDEDGNIKIPVIGKVKADGLTKRQLEDTIAFMLFNKKLLIDPIVVVRFLNYRVTVIGEVGRPTTISVVNEKMTILEALGIAGDLTVYAKRENILLIRENDTAKILHRINLNSPAILSSPYYYLKSNDVIYVEARKEKTLATSRTQQLLPIIISILGFVAIILTQVIKN